MIYWANCGFVTWAKVLSTPSFFLCANPSFLAGGAEIVCEKFHTNLQVKKVTTPNITAWTPATTYLEPFFGNLNKTPGDRTKKRIAQ
jgi:hypothetical protein